MLDISVVQQSKLIVNIFDGTREPFSADVDILYLIFDGSNNQLTSIEQRVSSMSFNLPFYDNLTDNHRVVVSAEGWQQAGYTPVYLSPEAPTTLDLMLIPKNPIFNFGQAPWERIKGILSFLAHGISDSAGRDRYNDLMRNTPELLASFFNITSSLAQTMLSDGSRVLDYIKEINWDRSLSQDRLFVYCDTQLIHVVRHSGKRGLFVAERVPFAFHPGATASWRQISLGEANVQLTFHEQDTKVIDGVSCVLIEPDINYYKDLVSHTILEAIPKTFNGGLTAPLLVYVLRWIAGRRAGGVDFNPPYTIVAS